MYTVSVVVVTYNSEINKIKTTIKSVIMQKNVKIQLIVCDDGSNNNHFIEIDDYMKERKVENYSLIANSVNRGTVANTLSGCNIATGDYIITLGPGDGLIHEDIIFQWIQEMEREKKKWSFSDVICYNYCDDNVNVVEINAYPQSIEPYIKHNDLKTRWNYLVLGDVAFGAAMVAKTDIYIEYLSKLDGIVKYGEDNVWRLMVFDGIVASYYNKPAVFYEYGSGISTSGNNEWGNRIKQDWISANHEMMKYVGDDAIKNKIIKLLSLQEKKYYRFYSQFLRGKLILSLKRRMNPRKTCVPTTEELDELTRLLTI